MDVGFLSCGDVRVSVLDTDGNAVSYSAVTNFTSLKVTIPDPDLKQRISKQIASNGQALDEVSTPKPTTMTAAFDTINSETLGWAFRATPEGVDITAGTVTTEAATAAHDAWVKLAHQRLSALTVKSSDGTTTFDEGDDYIADLNAGFLSVLSTGAITDGQVLKIGYSFAAVHADDLDAATISTQFFRIEGRFKNLANGKEGWLTIPKVNASPSGDFDFLGDDFLTPSIKGTCIALNGAPPFTFRLER